MPNLKKPIVELKNLSITRSIPILKNVNWTIRPGEHWAVLGANGSGKTSLLNALTAYMTVSDGEMFVLGRKHGQTDWRELRKSIGIVSASIVQRVDGHETVFETVGTGKDALINSWWELSPADQKKTLAMLRKIECLEIKNRAFKHLSQGERQRVLIGRAMMSNLKLLILDEPCAGLDPGARERFLNFVQRFVKNKKIPTLIFVTHHIEEIIPEMTHVLVLKEGQVLAAGLKNNVLTDKILSQAFNMNIHVQQKSGRFSITVKNTSIQNWI